MYYLQSFFWPFLLLLLLGCQAEDGDVEINFGDGTPVYGPQPDVGGDGDADTARDDKESEKQDGHLGKETEGEVEKRSPSDKTESDEREEKEGLEPGLIARPWEETNPPLTPLPEPIVPIQNPTQIPLRDCPEINDLQGIQEGIRDVVCGFITWANVPYIHHSGLRHGPKGQSRHNTGHALDFRINSYEGMHRRQKLGMWNVDVGLFIHYFMHQVSDRNLGLGIYCDSNNPFFHVDTREKDATWSRIGSKYRGFQDCLDWLHNELR